MAIADKIKELRQRFGISQSQLSRRLGADDAMSAVDIIKIMEG